MAKKKDKEAEEFDKGSEIKQVIVMRKDLKMRRGKEVAQGSHASMLWLVHRLTIKNKEWPNVKGDFDYFETDWFNSSGMAKICVRVDSEEELLDIHKKALMSGLNSHMVIDSGRTEFNGVPTRTCLAIGPDYARNIDPITGHLKLY